MIAPTRPAVLPFRWEGHRRDICAVITDGDVRFVARDILEALGQPLDEHLEKYPGHDAESTLLEHATGITWSPSNAQAVVAASGNEHAPALAAFLARIDSSLAVAPAAIAKVATPHLAPVTQLRPAGDPPAASDHDAPIGGEPLAPYFSVAIAAKILSRDPAIDVGRQRLFDFMHARSWVTRSHGDYQPTREYVFLGYMTTVPVKLPGRTYLQVCITPEGLQQLHTLLGGVAAIDLKPVDSTLI